MGGFRYETRSGRLVSERGSGAGIIAIGYAGAKDCINDPEKARVRSCGPIPQGRYRIYERSHPRFAYPAYALVPLEGTETFGRTGFWIHGDNRARNRSASTGCIVIDRAARLRLRRELLAGADPVLTVVP
ncbi:tlde1 domain-containing protein [Tsuneonella sp. CC-YZS046]|uniref:tlde1 domain-containing protein n=1 Tax=Tsuneonella sp. CC-YZS046 TaxID=3042152 RepID=UPI003A7F1D20